MFKEINKNDSESWESISRKEYGLPNKADDLKKLNSNSLSNNIIVFDNYKYSIEDGFFISINKTKVNEIINATINNSLNEINYAVLTIKKLNNIKIFNDCIISHNKRILVKGFVKNIKPVFANNDTYFNIEIKSFTGLLLDTSVPRELSFINSNLKEIINKVCNYFNISVFFKSNNIINYKINNEIDNSISADLNENCWNFLKRLCNSRGLLIRDIGESLEIGIIEEAKSKISLIYGESSVNEWLPIYNYDSLARYYEIYSQFKENSKILITFDLVKLPITKRIINKDLNPGIISNYGNWIVCREIGRAIKLQVKVHADIEINVGDFLIVKNSFIGFEKETKLICENILINYPNNKILILTLPFAYSGILPTELPLC